MDEGYRSNGRRIQEQWTKDTGAIYKLFYINNLHELSRLWGVKGRRIQETC